MSDDVGKVLSRRTRRAFLLGGAGALLGFAGWRMLARTSPLMHVPDALQKVLRWDEMLARSAFSATRLSQAYPKSEAKEPKENGDVGLEYEVDLEDWSLRVEGIGLATPLVLRLADLQKLPRTEVTTELRCVEGWSTVVSWAGARFSDFVARYLDAKAPSAGYVGLVTPDKQYYVGLDMASMLHPQTLLCYEMNGALLSDDHGAPLRLVVPTKYGIKNLKRIGTIVFANDRPPDYWHERGYDYYAGL